jgi:ABC-2 type transport system ATP-binding protein
LEKIIRNSKAYIERNFMNSTSIAPSSASTVQTIPPCVSLRDLVKKYGDFTAVGGISFDVLPGEIFGFLGVNGAGKTTTLRMLAGTLVPSSGSISICGISLLDEPERAKSCTGYIPDRPYLYTKLTGQEFIEFVADLYNLERANSRPRMSALLQEFGLDRWKHELIETYSHGMRQRLATVAALIHEPKLLVVDEPMVGLDPHGAKLLKDSFRRYAASGMGILLSTHSLNVAEELADRLAVVHEGRILAMGTIEEIRRQSGVQTGTLEHVFLELTGNTDNPWGTRDASDSP